MMNTGRGYRYFVSLISVFFILGGLMFAVFGLCLVMPITSPFPFVESDMLNRQLLGIASLVTVGIGVGLLFRNRFAWYALLVYLGSGVLIPVASAWDAKKVAAWGYLFPILGSLINGVVGVGLFVALRPAFSSARTGYSHGH
ncbi:MAG: hypothetical protein JSS02_28070, partial [Planctomycetes bacterium]|nr:hypothetical protein [Planctomycetota bacterium]